MKSAKQILQLSLRLLKKQGRRAWFKGADAGLINGWRTAKPLVYGTGVLEDARNMGLRSVETAYDRADCFCARGLIRKFGGQTKAAENALVILAASVPKLSGSAFIEDPSERVVDYNDESRRTFKQVVAWFERAVKSA